MDYKTKATTREELRKLAKAFDIIAETNGSITSQLSNYWID